MITPMIFLLFLHICIYEQLILENVIFLPFLQGSLSVYQ